MALSAVPPSQPNIALEGYRLPKVSSSMEDAPGGAFGSYALPALSEPIAPPSQRTAEQERRHEAWQRLVMPRRRSLALDEAAAAEARRAAGIDTLEEGEAGEEENDEDSTPSAVATSLRSKYVAKEAAGKRGRKKKEEEVGPSGMTYTPLEKQYMALRAQWPGVMLMMEGEINDVETWLTHSGIQVQVNLDFGLG